MTAIRDDVVSGLAPNRAQTRLYPGLAQGRNPLHVLLLSPRSVPGWIADFIALARTGHSVRITVIAIDGEVQTEGSPSLPLDMRLFLALERLRHRDMGERIRRAELSPAPASAVSSTDLADRVAQVAAEHAPDLVLLDGPVHWHAALAGIARLGCWRIDCNLLDTRYAGLALLAPVLAGEDATPCNLVLVDESGTTSALVSSVGTTHPGSFRLQRNHAFAKLPAMLLRALREISGRDIHSDSTPVLRLMIESRAPFRFGAGIRAFLTTLRHILRWQIQKRRPEDLWLLLLRHGERPLDPVNPRIEACSLLLAPRDDYWADPCAVEHDGRRLIFAEEYPSRTHKAVIVCLQLRADAQVERMGIALDQTCHLSYPQAFEWHGQWYLTVESATARCVRLYRASDFPLRWEPVTDLVSDRVCVDPTLYYRDGHWYLFVNISESGGSTSEELFLFVSEQLTGPFRPHPANPIVSDVRRARPAGRLFEHKGRLIRPGQDCAPSYGTAIVFSEILELSPEAYREQPLARLDGSWSSTLDGCHTYSAVSSLEVLDARGHVPADCPRLKVLHSPIANRADVCEVPLVSVLMIVSGPAEWLEQAIENVGSQTFADHEILIASSDPSAMMVRVEPYLREHRVRVIHVTSLCQADARNTLIGVARGRYLAWYEPGYHWIAQHLELGLEWLERDASVGMVHAPVFANDSQRALFGRSLALEQAVPLAASPYAALLLWQSHPFIASVMVRRSTALTVGGFDLQFPCSEHMERDYWLRLAAVASVGMMSDAHLLPVGTMCANRHADSEVWTSRQMLIDKHALTTQGKDLRRQAEAALEADRAMCSVAQENYRVALRAYARALRRDPFHLRVWHDLLRWALRLPRASDGTSL